MKRVLIICDLFPPAFAPRMGYLSKYLQKLGVYVEVVAEQQGDNTFEFLSNICPVTFVSFYSAPNKFLHKLEWFGVQLMDFLIHYKDRKMARVAAKVCSSKPFDLILCASFRSFPLIAAKEVAQKYNLPLLVDLRDIIEQYPGNEFLANLPHSIPWIDNCFTNILKRKLLNDRNNVLKSANQVTTVSPWHVEQLKQYNPNVSLIYNGFDPELFVANHHKIPRFTITYTGRILSLAMRNPTMLFEALKLTQLTPKEIKIEWYVDPVSESLLKTVAKQHGVTEFMSYHNYVPASEVPTILNNSGILLLLAEKSGENAPKGIMTTKLFEFMAVEKPILCIPSDESFLEENIKKTRSGIAARSTEEAAAFILDNYRQWETQGYTATMPDHEEIKRFSRKGQAEQFMQLFETLSSAGL